MMALAKSIKSLAVFLLLCIQVAPFFFTTSLYLSQYHLQRTAYHRLKNERVVCLTFSYKQAAGIEAGSEINVNGKMMDVQSVYCLQDKVFVYGYYDETDAALNEKLAAMINGQSDKEEGDDLVIKVWQLFMMPCTNQQGMQLQHFADKSLQQYITFAANLSVVYLPVATPPPLFV